MSRHSIIIGMIILCTCGTIFFILYELATPKINMRYIPISVNIDSNNLINANPKEDTLYFADLASANITLVNTGNSVQTYLQVDNVANATHGPLGDNIFIYVSFTYYFISNNSNGVTGTTIDGKGFPYEIRILYRNRKYSTIDEAVKNKDGLAEHVYTVNICSTPNMDFEVLSKAFQNISQPGNSVMTSFYMQITPLFISSNYYSYLGSFSDTLTNQTYQCSTVLIFQSTDEDFTGCITQEQFHEAFGTLKSKSGEPAAYTLPHSTSKMNVSLHTGWKHVEWDADSTGV